MQYISIPKKDTVNAEINVYKSAESEEYLVPDIDTVQIQQEEGDIGGSSAGEGLNVYIIEGNPLVYGKTTSELINIANNIKSIITELSYCPTAVETNGAPWQEVGDRIEIATSEGIINTIIMKRDFSGIQGAMDKYNSTGSQELTRPFSIESEIIQIKGLSAILKRTVEEVSNELTNFEKNTYSKFTQTAQQISLEVTRAKEEEEKLSSRISITDEAITSEVTRATLAEGDLGSKLTQTEKLIELKVSKGDVSNQISVETGGISIKGNRFSWESTYSSMTADGKLTATSGTFTGDVVANSFRTSDGKIVLENGKLVITGAEINGTANSSTIGCKTLSASAASITTLQDCQTGNINSLNVTSIWCGGNIDCKELYPSGSWWKGWGLTETMKWLDDRISSLGG